MENSFIKESFINNLDSAINNFEEAKIVFKNDIPSKKITAGAYYNILNRKNYLKETCLALNSKEQKLVFLSGFSGTGKTEFINTISLALEENIFHFYYECSEITHLDDVILSLFNYLKKVSAINPEFKRNYKVATGQSIDERLINSIKNIDKLLLITIDGFEHLVKDNFEEEQTELVHFIEYITNLPQIKLIIAGQKLYNIPFSHNRERIFEIKLGALDEADAQKLLIDNGMTETESCFNQIYQVTRGYPENLLIFANTLNLFNQSSFEFMQECLSLNSGFEDFIFKKIYSTIAEDYSKIASLLLCIRHSITVETLNKLNFTTNIEEKIQYLQSKMLIVNNRGNFCIKKFVKKLINQRITRDEKIQVHRYLYELYSEQISKKLDERILPISRKLLYTEQFYHYTCLMNIGDKSLTEINTGIHSNIKPDFKYLYAGYTDTFFSGETNLNSQIIIKSPREKEKAETQTDNKITLDNLKDFDIEFSEEERALIALENEDKTSVEINRSNERNANDIKSKAGNLVTEGQSFFKQGKFEDAIKKFDESLVLYEILRDKPAVNNILVSIANAYNECYKHDVALMYYHKILASDDRNLSSEIIISTLSSIADIYNYRENFDGAIKYYEKAYLEAEKQDNKAEMSKLCFKKALIFDDKGETEKALQLYRQNIEICNNTEINPYVSSAYANMAIIYDETEQFELSIKHFLDSLKYDIQTNNREGQYETLSRLGDIYFEKDDYNKANDYFHKALEIAKQTNDPYKIAMSCLDIGDIYMQEKNYEKSLKAFIAAGKTIEKTISTDSREKIERRFKKVISEIGEQKFKEITEKLRKKHD